jgi:hypothetical protein
MEPKPNVINYRPKRHIPCPEPMPGWAIVKLEDVELQGRVLLPLPGATGMDTAPNSVCEGYKKARVVKRADEYPFNATEIRKTPFAQGDFVLFTSGARGVSEKQLEIMLPPAHMAVWIADLAGWTPCPMDESKAKS